MFTSNLTGNDLTGLGTDRGGSGQRELQTQGQEMKVRKWSSSVVLGTRL